MPALIDLTGQRFGRLTVVFRAADKRGVKWTCRCDCGELTFVDSASLRKGATQSCGCLHRELVGNRYRTHGRSTTNVYGIWVRMRQRCENPKASNYKYYGGRGIKVCRRWQRFDNFMADMGPRPAGYSIDRINNDGDYEPKNCKWVSHREQMSNMRRNRFVTLDGVRMTLIQAARKAGLSEATIRYRLDEMGWSEDRALHETSLWER